MTKKLLTGTLIKHQYKQRLTNKDCTGRLECFFNHNVLLQAKPMYADDLRSVETDIFKIKTIRSSQAQNLGIESGIFSISVIVL